jgi:CRISPR type IV-associated DEAD/DEAH-box helicase Csf4
MPSCATVNGRIRLKPSSRGDRLSADEKDISDDLWCREVAEEIIRIDDTAAGGSLVLMTSYVFIGKVRAALLDLCPKLADRLVFARQGEAGGEKLLVRTITIEEQKRQFLRFSFEGKKAIWLALGNAWTGINLSGGDPMIDLYGQEIPSQEDNVLTDLVIPRLPFGINKSVTHTHRIAYRKKVPWERIDTLLRLRQGVGRLVRRHGVPQNRRIHILDARLCEGSLSDMMMPVGRAVGATQPG